MLPRVPQWWIAMLGLIRLGAVPVPGDAAAHRSATWPTGWKAPGSARSSPARTELPRWAASRERACWWAASQPGWIDFDRGVRQAGAGFRGERTRSDDPGIIYFTSATTGNPKMVLHTQASYGLGHRLTGQLWLDLRPEDVHWNLSDLGWGKAAWSSFYGPWQMGACVFALDAPGKFDPVLALKTLAEFPITTWCAPPTALRLIVRQDLSRWRFPHLRHCVSAGEPLNPEVLSLWRDGDRPDAA